MITNGESTGANQEAGVYVLRVLNIFFIRGLHLRNAHGYNEIYQQADEQISSVTMGLSGDDEIFRRRGEMTFDRFTPYQKEN